MCPVADFADISAQQCPSQRRLADVGVRQETDVDTRCCVHVRRLGHFDRVRSATVTRTPYPFTKSSHNVCRSRRR